MNAECVVRLLRLTLHRISGDSQKFLEMYYLQAPLHILWGSEEFEHPPLKQRPSCIIQMLDRDIDPQHVTIYC